MQSCIFCFRNKESSVLPLHQQYLSSRQFIDIPGSRQFNDLPRSGVVYQHNRFNAIILVNHSANTHGIHITGTMSMARDPSTDTRIPIFKVCLRLCASSSFFRLLKQESWTTQTPSSCWTRLKFPSSRSFNNPFLITLFSILLMRFAASAAPITLRVYIE